MSLVVHGTKGSIELLDDTHVQLFNLVGESVDISPITSLQSQAPGNGLSDVEGEFSAFYNAIRCEGKGLGVSTEEAFHHLAFIVAALESVETEKAIKIAQV
jgi:UDP-N-acetyl-2-amino-2-deoxyglucuronate dehydrogenase